MFVRNVLVAVHFLQYKVQYICYRYLLAVKARVNVRKRANVNIRVNLYIRGNINIYMSKYFDTICCPVEYVPHQARVLLLLYKLVSDVGSVLARHRVLEIDLVLGRYTTRV